jgi:hypothetical protein
MMSVMRFPLTCPETEQPMGMTVEIETDAILDLDVALAPHVERCPRCGNEHRLLCDELHPEPNGEGGDGAGVREPRIPPDLNDQGTADASR